MKGDTPKFNSEFTPEKWWERKTIRLAIGFRSLFRGKLAVKLREGPWHFSISFISTKNGCGLVLGFFFLHFFFGLWALCLLSFQLTCPHKKKIFASPGHHPRFFIASCHSLGQGRCNHIFCVFCVFLCARVCAGCILFFGVFWGGVFVVLFLWCGCVFVVVFLWWCFCGGVLVGCLCGVVVFLWWCGGVFVIVVDQ